MVEIVLGALVVIGVFIFWCDVMDSWNNVFRWNQSGTLIRRTSSAIGSKALKSGGART